MRKQTSDVPGREPGRAPLDIFAQRADQLPIEPLTVRISTATRITGIGRSKLYELIKAGEIETAKVGASTLLSVESLRRLVATRSRSVDC